MSKINNSTKINNTPLVFNVLWWMYSAREDGYVDCEEDVEATSGEHAIELMRLKYPRGKDFKIWQ